jgi:predicted XRE-type DNA-binding protein
MRPKKALNFVSQINKLIESQGRTQRQIAKECSIALSSVNRLCNSGIGSDDTVCSILFYLGVKRRRILDLLVSRNAELSAGIAKSIWEGFRYAFLNADAYLEEICPFPIERAYAATQFGISFTSLILLAKQCGLSSIADLVSIDPWKMLPFAEEFQKRYGKAARDNVLSIKCEGYPPVLLLDFLHSVDISEYPIFIDKCVGKLLFGLPHVVVGDYHFEPGGLIGAHRNTGGIEFLFSCSGTYELTVQNRKCATLLEPCQKIYILDARKKHAIKLISEEPGRLLMIRFYPSKREVLPGHGI